MRTDKQRINFKMIYTMYIYIITTLDKRLFILIIERNSLSTHIYTNDQTRIELN